MTRRLPAGTVTFLFTDVEGSTRLLHELGAEGYAEALAEHRRVIREACSAEGGVEVDTQGDAFFFAFPTAPGALAAASALTEALATGAIRVRTGVHTGTPLVTEEGYVGGDVHRAARIAAAGHGGQVLVSSSTAQLVGTDLRDLGEHRLKDLAAPERVYQLGEERFPALKTLYRTNLPVPATSFLGRERELGEVVGLLARDDVRLLSLTGPGGTGKTRLALQAAAETAERFPDGLWWVALAPLRDARLVLREVAHALSVLDEAGRALSETVTSAVAGKRLLLLLDNAEHLLPGLAPELAALLQTTGPQLVVTSRERLQLQGEHVYPVPTLGEGDALELFVSRARALEPSFVGDGAVVELCERLDRLPLALELAAARTVVFAPEQLLERLGQRLDLLRGGRDADPRQQTLRATIEWSYDLLDPTEQALFRRLAVFVGGCSFEAAEAVAGADADSLQSLIDKSLVRKRQTALGPRYWMLETIRELAAERLTADGSGDGLRRCHAEYYLRLGESLGLTMESLERVGAQRHDVAFAEADNFRAAVDWATDVDPELAVRIAFALENFWVTHNPEEGMRRFDALLAFEDRLPAGLRAAANRGRGNTGAVVESRAEAVAFYERARGLYREAGDDVAVAMMEHRIAVNRLALERDFDRARASLELCIARFRELGFRVGEVQALGSLGWIEERAGNRARALELLEESVDGARALGFVWTEESLREGLAYIALQTAQLDEAETQGRRALALARQTGDRVSMMTSLALLANVAAKRRNRSAAGRLWGAVEAEEQRFVTSIWRELRERYAEGVLPLEGDADFEQGRESGRESALEEVVLEELGAHR